MLLESIVVAIIPVFFYITIIYWVDRYEKEPLWLLASAFLWGAIPSIIFAYIVNTLLSLPFYIVGGQGAADFTGAVFIAPFVEESIKGILLLGILLVWRHEIDSPLDGIIYGAMVGLGFAMVENVFYFENAYAAEGLEGWQSVIVLRNLFGLNHSLFTGVTGLGIAIARLAPSQLVRFTMPILGWGGAVFLHFMHNFLASIGGLVGPLVCLGLLTSDYGALTVMLVIILWALIQEKRWIKEYLKEEVANGTISVHQYETASSGFKRLFHRLNLLFAYGPLPYWHALRFYHRCSELAYKKHHYSIFKDDKSLRMAHKLRQELADLGQKIR